MRSACRGEALKTSMPKRARSKSAAPVAIISMAQQAKPKVAGHTLLRLAHLTTSSRVPVRKLREKLSRPIRSASSKEPLGRLFALGSHAPDGGLAGPLRRQAAGWLEALGRPPVQGPVA